MKVHVKRPVIEILLLEKDMEYTEVQNKRQTETFDTILHLRIYNKLPLNLFYNESPPMNINFYI